MTVWQSLLLGILQGLTEFLPVSSSGHLEIGKAILGIHTPESLIFTVVVHGGTVLSIFVVFWREIWRLIKAPFTLEWNEDNKYIAKLLVSAIPAGFVGLFFKDQVEDMFTGNLLFVGLMLWVTTILLFLTIFAKDRGRKINFLDAFIIGIAQAIAIVPGISRSGSTIATGLLLGNKKDEVAKFSFLMVIIPVIGANLVDFMHGTGGTASSTDISTMALLVGFLASFITGVFACKFMIEIVKRSKLSYFAIYTFIVGGLAIFFALK